MKKPNAAKLYPVFMPSHLVRAATCWLARQEWTAPEDDAESGSERVAVIDNDTWSKAECLNVLAQLGGKSRGILFALAAANGAAVRYSDLAAAVDAPVDRLRVYTARITRVAHALRGQKIWPIEVKVLDPSAPLGQRYAYRMDPQIASWMRSADEIDDVDDHEDADVDDENDAAE